MNGNQTDQSVSAVPTPKANGDVVSQALNGTFIKDSSRIDVDSLMNEFRRELGTTKWEKYRDSLTNFLMGRLSRPELVRSVRENLGGNGFALRNHNTLVLSLLANAIREIPPGTESSLAEWKAKTKNRSRYSGMDSANDRMHREILTMPVRERRRIKNIAKEALNAAKNPIVPPPPPVLIATRQALLPHIPYVPDIRGIRRRDVRETNGSAPDAVNGAGSEKAGKDLNAQEETPTTGGSASLLDPLLNLHAGRASGPLTWTQDIIQGLDAPLATESQEIPDNVVLGTRMLSVALEHGLLEGIGAGTTDIVMVGLEMYLRGIVEQLVAMKHRRLDSNNPLTAADLDLFVNMRPSEVAEYSAPLYRLGMDYLVDEETAMPSVPPVSDKDDNSPASGPDEISLTRASSLGAPAGGSTDSGRQHTVAKRPTPLDFPTTQEPKVPRVDQPKVPEGQLFLEENAQDEHNKGTQLVDELLG